MIWIQQILIPFLTFLFYLFSVLGMTVGAGLVMSPEKIAEIEAFLSQRLFKPRFSQKNLGETLDQSQSLEHLFFNHHRVTGFFLIVTPVLFLFLSKSLPHITKNPVDDYQSSAFWLFLELILFPVFVFFLKGVAVFSIVLGLFLWFSPHHAFRWIRTLSRTISTDPIHKAVLEEEIPLNEMFYRYSTWSGFFLFTLSTLLLYLLIFHPDLATLSTRSSGKVY